MEKAAPDFDDIAKMPWGMGELQKGDLHSALNAFAVRFVLDYRRPVRPAGFHADNFVCGFGATLWLMGDRLGAANVWANVCEAAYRGRISYSSYGAFQAPLLLWFAAVWLKNDDWHTDAEQTITKLLSRRQPIMGAQFPARIARLLRKEQTLDEIKSSEIRDLQADLPNAPSDLREDESIMAHFYAGVRAYEEADIAGACEIWDQVMPPNYEGPLEYYLLLHERKKLVR